MMNKKNNKSSFKKDSFKSKKSVPRNIKIEEIAEMNPSELKGKRVSVKGIVDRVVQTGGPTVFYISDGTGTLALKAFQGAGIRSYPDIEEEDAISSIVSLEEFKGEVEGEVSILEKLEDKDKESLIEEMSTIERKRAEIEPVDFMVKSPILDKLKDPFIKAATEIRLAIFQNRPIIVRHHNDADGYSSGFSLEKAIIPLIQEQHKGIKAVWEYYTRAPCSAPFYEIDDSIRDTANSLRNVAKFSNKLPLVIIADNGSSPEDLLAIKQGKVHGIDFIVIDHHFFDEDVISPEVLVHINPFLVGENGSAFSAGMLCAELARFINPSIENIEPIPAMAGLADRIDNPEVMSDYLKIAKDKGYDKELLHNISSLIDFVSAKLKFMEAREYIEVLFGEPREKQKALVDVMAPYIDGLEAKGLKIAQAASKVEKINNKYLQLLFVEESFPGFGFYPKPGKAIGLLHDSFSKDKKEGVVSAGVLNSAITMRATDEANFSVHELIEFLNKKLPDAFVEGGGHKNAGAITFIPSKQKEILDCLREYIKNIK